MLLDTLLRACTALLAACLAAGTACATTAADDEILGIDHYVASRSQSPAIRDMPVSLYLRERVQRAAVAAGTAPRPVVLFVHGSTYPSVPDFDLPYQDYSWMQFLARAGFDVFAIDMVGYGRSSRPHMDNPCNAEKGQQAQLGLGSQPGAGPCTPSFAQLIAGRRYDWDDIDAGVDYIRRLRQVERVSLIGWSGGGSRIGGYAALHPDKVARLVFVAPGYWKDAPDLPAAPQPEAGALFSVSTREDSMRRWDQQLHCDDQFDPAIRDAIWASNMAFDPLGAGWGPGVVRVPRIGNYRIGWNQAMAAKVAAPSLIFAGELDNEVPLAVSLQLHRDLPVANKLFFSLGCTSHYSVYERAYKFLHEASKEWLQQGTVQGRPAGEFQVDRFGRGMRPRP